MYSTMRGFVWVGIGLLMLFAFLAKVGVTSADRTVVASLEGVAGSHMSGTATFQANGDATDVSLELAGLRPNTGYRAHVHAGTCATASAGFADVPPFAADAVGRATARGEVLFRGREHVALATIADGGHILDVHPIDNAGIGESVACASIGEAATAPPPSQGPETGSSMGLPAVGVLGAVGVVALRGALLLRRR